ncbi:hypothetical protein EC988_002451 [Linderina pennispora]|nr:hypothetical protein EC988_002451 [Linderina pennispora]
MAQTLQSQAPFRLIQPHNSEQQHAIQSLVQELERLSPDMFANTSGNERLALELPFAQPAPAPAAVQTTMPATGFVSLVPQPLLASITSSPAAAGPQAGTAPTQPASPAAPLFSAMPMSQQPVSIITTLSPQATSDLPPTALTATSLTSSLQLLFTAADVPTDPSNNPSSTPHRSRGTELPFGLWIATSPTSTGLLSAEESTLADSSSDDEGQELSGLDSDPSSGSIDVWSAEYSRLANSATRTSLSLAGTLLLPLLAIVIAIN